MNTITRYNYISRHCDALETVAWFLFGHPASAARVACRLAAHRERL